MEKLALQMAGVTDALRNFGLAAGKTVGQYVPSASRIKREVIGNPGKFYRQFQNARLFDRSGMYRMMLKPQGPLHAALTYGLPALSIYQASQAPEEMRGQAIGNAMGSVAGSFLGGPLGAVGQALGGMALGSLGQSVGKNFDPNYPQG